MSSWAEFEDDLSDAIADSIDMDWNSGDGARAVIRWLDENAARTVAWLVEWPDDGRMPTRYYHPISGWERDPNKAIWFARREDAEAMSGREHLRGINLVASQHVFGLTVAIAREAVPALIAGVERLGSLAPLVPGEGHDAGVVGWQPIETAPKDGAYVLIYPGLHRVPVVATWVRERGWFGFWRLPMTGQNDRSPYTPTHWMPLPALPGGSTAEEAV